MFVETRGLTKGYSGVPALKEVSLAAREGEVIAFVGFNGAGKTTLLRCIAGQVAPDRGNVAFDGVSFARDQLAVVLLTIALAGTMPFSCAPMPESLAGIIVIWLSCHVLRAEYVRR